MKRNKVNIHLENFGLVWSFQVLEVVAAKAWNQKVAIQACLDKLERPPHLIPPFWALKPKSMSL